MSLLSHGCQRHSFINSQTDSQMFTFPDQMNRQFVQILTIPNSSQNFVYWTQNEVKQKTFLFSVQRKSAWYMFSWFWFFCFICHLCLVHKINVQTPITAILSTYLIHLIMSTYFYRECKVQNGWIS